MSRLLSHERRLGLGPTRVDRGDMLDSASSDDDYSDDGGIHRTGMGPLDDEERQERLLSDRHGEAEDVNTGNKKRSSIGEKTDQEIADEYAAAGDKRKAKKPRPTLQPDKLVGAEHGLIVVKETFPSKMKPFYPPSKSKKSRTDAAALFSRKLVSAYMSYCEDLFPSLAPEDVLLKIESFGSKRQIKDYLQHHREDVRNQYVERQCGKERGQSLLQQLHEGLMQQDEQEEVNADLRTQPEVSAPLTNRINNNEPSLSRDSILTAPTLTDRDESVEEIRDDRASINATTPVTKRRIEDSSDEEEATFDDDEQNGQEETRTEENTDSALSKDRGLPENIEATTVSHASTDNREEPAKHYMVAAEDGSFGAPSSSVLTDGRVEDIGILEDKGIEQEPMSQTDMNSEISKESFAEQTDDFQKTTEEQQQTQLVLEEADKPVISSQKKLPERGSIQSGDENEKDEGYSFDNNQMTDKIDIEMEITPDRERGDENKTLAVNTREKDPDARGGTTNAESTQNSQCIHGAKHGVTGNQ